MTLWKKCDTRDIESRWVGGVGTKKKQKKKRRPILQSAIFRSCQESRLNSRSTAKNIRGEANLFYYFTAKK